MAKRTEQQDQDWRNVYDDTDLVGWVVKRGQREWAAYHAPETSSVVAKGLLLGTFTTRR
jgi:hypothetical protein